jgi:hypothetical protein
MSAASIDWNGPARQPCPACDKGQRDKALSVTRDERGGVAHCFRCEYVETLRGEVRAGAPRMPISAPQKHEVLSNYGRQLWDACKPLYGLAVDYLQARCCVIPPKDGDLRWHPELKHTPSGYVGPALVALGTDAVDRTPRTLHRTWVRADGRKADIDPPRMLLGGHRKAGAVIRLWPDEAVTTGLAVAEGIETALALAHAFTPVWACIDAGNLSAFPVLAGIETLTIAEDHDEAGEMAATRCADRWARAGREVYIVKAPTAGADLADVVSEVAA